MIINFYLMTYENKISRINGHNTKVIIENTDKIIENTAWHVVFQ